MALSTAGRSRRYLLVVILFCLISVMYLFRLFYIQISGRGEYDSDTTRRTVTVQAVRGEIYDRNGVKLVENCYRYDIKLYADQFSGVALRVRNESMLALLSSLAENGGAEREEMFFPFEGTHYPYYAYSSDAADGDSLRSYRLRRVLSDLGLDADTSAEKLRDHYIETYELLAVNNRGERLYNDDEIDALIRLYYDMDALRFRTGGEYTFASDVSLSLITHIKERAVPLVNFAVTVTRNYCYPGYASHILGAVGPIYFEEWDWYNEQGYQMNAMVGKSGCESAFESYLRGTDGTMIVEEDANGNILSTTLVEAPVSGNDVYLTIDINLQIAAEEGLAENVLYVSNRAQSVETGSECVAGAAVVLAPDTFDVLAIASCPTYNLATYNEDYVVLSSDPAKPLLNRALQGAYAPGSTYKLGMAAVALMEGVIEGDTAVSCTGRYPSSVISGSVGCSTYGENHRGAITVREAIAYSCNSFFCEMGQRLGIETMESYFSKLGIGEATGFELGGTTGVLAGPTYLGLIQSSNAWQPGNTWQSAIGQSDNLASPLQLACYMGTLANGGTRYSAHLLFSVHRFGSAEEIYRYEQTDATVLSRLSIPESVRATVMDGMRMMVSESAIVQRWINASLPVTVGGKTGTAQTGGDCDNALFVCAAPYNTPELVISVVLEKGYAGSYAALTAGRILEAYYGN